MLIPQEFVESFDMQYPRLDIDFQLSESLEKFPEFKNQIENNVRKYHTITYPFEYKGNIYDIIHMTHHPKNDLSVKHPINAAGYAIIVQEIFKSLNTNKSEKTFEFVLDDLKDINLIFFEAGIKAQIGNYYLTRSIELINAWLSYCKTHSKFQMNYDDYNSIMGFDKSESSVSNSNIDTTIPSIKKLPKPKYTNNSEQRYSNPI